MRKIAAGSGVPQGLTGNGKRKRRWRAKSSFLRMLRAQVTRKLTWFSSSKRNEIRRRT